MTKSTKESLEDIEVENNNICDSDEQYLLINLKNFTHLFIVMDLIELDFKKLFDTVP